MSNSGGDAPSINKEQLIRCFRRFGQDVQVLNFKFQPNAQRYLTEIGKGKRVTWNNIDTIFRELKVGGAAGKARDTLRRIAGEEVGSGFSNWETFVTACENLFYTRRQQAPPPAIEEVLLVRVRAALDPAQVHISDGSLWTDGDPVVRADPLVRYLDSIRQPARVPNIFADGKTIILDEVYVELEASSLDTLPEVTASDAGLIDTSRRQRTRLHESRRVPMGTLFENGRPEVHVIFGDPGSGKSTLLRHLLSEIGKGHFAPDSLPFYIPLKAFKDTSASSPPSFFDYIVRKCLQTPEKDFQKTKAVLMYGFTPLRTPRKLILLLDGLDEIAEDEVNFRRVTQAIDDISHMARIIITSRRAGYRRPFDGEFERYEIMEMGDGSIRKLARNWFTHVTPKSGRFIQSFQHYLFADEARVEMARNPTLLSLLCYLNEGRQEGGFLDADTRTGLYKAAVNKLITDFEIRTGRKNREAFADLSRFSAWLFSAGGRIPRQLFSDGDYFDYTSNTGAPRGNLHDCWLHSKLVGQWNEEHRYFFTHLSFQEYFTAEHLAKLSREEVRSVILQNRYNTYWNEVWKYYAGHCAAMLEGGDERFRDLAGAAADPATRDVFGQCLFWLAPLCLEFGVSHAESVLRIDLKGELQKLIEEGRLATRTHHRMLVRLDPRRCLEASLFLFQEFFAEHGLKPLDIPDGVTLPASRPSWLDAKSEDQDEDSVEEPGMAAALHLLEAIHHPAATELQTQLIMREATDPDFPIEIVARCGPEFAGPRNELLKDSIISRLPEALDFDRRSRLIKYLVLAPSGDTSAALLKWGRHALSTEDKLAVLSGLIEMKSSDSVEFAQEILKKLDPEQRFEVASGIRDVPGAEIESFLESWLDGEKDADVIGAILDSLAFIALSRDLRLAEHWARHKNKDIRAAAIHLHAARGGRNSVPFLRGIIANPRTKSDRLTALAAAGEHRLNLPEIGVQCDHAVETGDRATAMMAEIAAIRAFPEGVEPDAAWVQKRLVRFDEALQKQWHRKDSAGFGSWVSALVSTSFSLRAAFGALVDDRISLIDDALMREVLALFERYPTEAPMKLVMDAFGRTEDFDVRPIALGILAARRSPLLIQIVHSDPDSADNLLGEAVEQNLMIFKDGWLDPSGVLHPWAEQ